MISFWIVNRTQFMCHSRLAGPTSGPGWLPSGRNPLCCLEAWPLLLIDQRSLTPEADKKRPLCLATSLNGPTEALASLATTCKGQVTQSRNAGSPMEGLPLWNQRCLLWSWSQLRNMLHLCPPFFPPLLPFPSHFYFPGIAMTPPPQNEVFACKLLLEVLFPGNLCWQMRAIFFLISSKIIGY